MHVYYRFLCLLKFNEIYYIQHHYIRFFNFEIEIMKIISLFRKIN